MQVRSASTGVGLTAAEAESVVRHLVRRRIVMMLMLLRNAGLIAVVSSLTISFVRPSTAAVRPRRVAPLFGGLAALWVTTRSCWVECLLLLGIVRARGRYVGASTGTTRARPDDRLLLYGRPSASRDCRCGPPAHPASPSTTRPSPSRRPGSAARRPCDTGRAGGLGLASMEPAANIAEQP